MTHHLRLLAATVCVLGIGTGISTVHASSTEKPGGCIKDGAIGAVGGHFVGHGHAKMGAVGGCLYGMHERHKWKKEQRAAANANPDQHGEAPSPHTSTNTPTPTPNNSNGPQPAH